MNFINPIKSLPIWDGFYHTFMVSLGVTHHCHITHRRLAIFLTHGAPISQVSLPKFPTVPCTNRSLRGSAPIETITRTSSAKVQGIMQDRCK